LKPHLPPMGRNTNHVHAVAAKFEESHSEAALLTSALSVSGWHDSKMTTKVME
jgi:hypothetical protein